MASTVALEFLGIACLLVSYLALRSLIPRHGKPASAWTSTESRATFVSLGLMILIITGLGLLVRGLAN